MNRQKITLESWPSKLAQILFTHTHPQAYAYAYTYVYIYLYNFE